MHPWQGDVHKYAKIPIVCVYLCVFYIWMGGPVVKWLALSTPNLKLPAKWDRSVWGLPVPERVLSGYSSLLPQPRHVLAGSTGDSKLVIDMNVSVNDCLSPWPVYYIFHVID